MRTRRGPRECAQGVFCSLARYPGMMELHGTVADNLGSALRSARRLRGHPVHADTLRYWMDLLHLARRQLALSSDPSLLAITLDLEKELADRGP